MRRHAGTAILLSALALAACQPPPSMSTSTPPGAGGTEVGTVSFELTLGGGYTIASVTYDISGNGFHSSADVSVANSATFRTIVGGIPFGTGYTAKLTVQDTDHRLLPCQGSSSFDVTSAGTTPVVVHLACKPVPTTTPPPPAVPVPRAATWALGALLLALGGRRVRRAVGRSTIVLAAAATLAATGCDAGPTSQNQDADPGAVSMALELAPGSSLNAVDYQISGPGSFMKSGTLDVSHSATLSASFSPLPPGTGFQLELRGTSVDGNARCLGSASFDVAARATTNVLVHLLCQQMTRNGSAALNGVLNACPLIDGVGASPAEVLVGQTLGLTATAHDLDGAPSPLGYQWSAPGATLSDATAQNPRLTCTAPGPVTLTLVVSDGDPTSGCPDTQTMIVSCTAP
jgi:hypothetical protein